MKAADAAAAAVAVITTAVAGAKRACTGMQSPGNGLLQAKILQGSFINKKGFCRHNSIHPAQYKF